MTKFISFNKNMALMRIFNFLVLLVIAAAVMACSNSSPKPQDITGQAAEGVSLFTSQYGLSFKYPDSWAPSDRDLPDRWSARDNKNNTLIMLISNANGKDLQTLGKEQVVQDLFPTPESVTPERIKQAHGILHMQPFGKQSWFTYGVKFSEKGVNSLVSGTLCGNNEILMVLVSDLETFEFNKKKYIDVRTSFKC